MIIIPKSLIGELKIREVKPFLKVTQQVSSRVGIQHEKHVIMRLGFPFFADFLISAKIKLALSNKSSSGLSSTQTVRCKVNQTNITEHTLCTRCSKSIIPFDHHQRGVIITSMFKGGKGLRKVTRQLSGHTRIFQT